jgi:alcohol dehydrogenase YqhD (iron-dependent ADH family)
LENFRFHNPTEIIFGREAEMLAGKEVKKYAKKILLHYGSKSIKRIGLYDRLIKSLKEANIDIHELPGVQPNPHLSLVKEGVKICRENNIAFILAAGGGSVIDSAKAIALGVPYRGDPWDFFTGNTKPEDALPVGVVLTVPAAGSESSDVSVITNEKTLLKKGFHSSFIRPKFAILNPEVTFSIDSYQTACGAADTLSHIMERYFTDTPSADLTDRLCEGAMRSVIENTPVVLEKPEDYDARAELMWASTVAHNGILGTGRIEDWGSHKLAHELGAVYGVAHGAALSIIFPAWMKYVYKHNIKRFAQYAVRVWDVDPCFGTDVYIAERGIARTTGFFKSTGLPTTLKELKISDDRFEEMAEKELQWGPIGKFVKLQKQDIVNIFKLSM